MQRVITCLLAICAASVVVAAASSAAAAVPRSRDRSVLSGGTVNATYAGGIAGFVTVQASGRRFAFVVDTGAAVSAVTSKAATALGLTATGPSQTVSTLGCRTSERTAEISGWRVGTVALPSARVGIIGNALSRDTLRGLPIGGLLGSDVLSQFGSVTFELARNRLVLGGRSANPRTAIPIAVRRHAGGVIETLRATINRHAARFVLDTGSPLTLLQSTAASHLGLRATRSSIKVSGATGCTVKAHLAQIVEWTAGPQPLPSAPALTVPARALRFPPQIPAIGVIGAETLFGFGRATIDFTHDRLGLGSPGPAARSTTAPNPLIDQPWGPLQLAGGAALPAGP